MTPNAGATGAAPQQTVAVQERRKSWLGLAIAAAIIILLIIGTNGISIYFGNNKAERLHQEVKAVRNDAKANSDKHENNINAVKDNVNVLNTRVGVIETDVKKMGAVPAMVGETKAAAMKMERTLNSFLSKEAARAEKPAPAKPPEKPAGKPPVREKTSDELLSDYAEKKAKEEEEERLRRRAEEIKEEVRNGRKPKRDEEKEFRSRVLEGLNAVKNEQQAVGERFNRLNGRIDAFDAKIERGEQERRALEERLNRRMDARDARIDALEQRISAQPAPPAPTSSAIEKGVADSLKKISQVVESIKEQLQKKKPPTAKDDFGRFKAASKERLAAEIRLQRTDTLIRFNWCPPAQLMKEFDEWAKAKEKELEECFRERENP